MEIIIQRKKQFASRLVPFGIVVGYEREKLIELVNNQKMEINNCKSISEKEGVYGKYNALFEQINIYPIKSGETIKIDVPNERTTVFAINFNFNDTEIYPFAASNELIVTKDTNILLKQTAAFTTVKLSITEI